MDLRPWLIHAVLSALNTATSKHVSEVCPDTSLTGKLHGLHPAIQYDTMKSSRLHPEIFVRTTTLFSKTQIMTLVGLLLLMTQTAVLGQSLQNLKIPETTAAVMVARPKAIIDDPAMEFMPHELLTAFGQSEFGIDPCKIDSLTVMVDAIENPNKPPHFAAVLHFTEPAKVSGQLLEDAETGELLGRPIYRFGEEDEPVLMVKDDQTLVLGNAAYIEKILVGKTTAGKLTDELKLANPNNEHVVVVMAMESSRSLLDEMLPRKSQLPPPYQGLRDLPDLIETATLKLNFNESPVNSLSLTGADEAAAKRIERTLRQGAALGRGALMNQMAYEFRDNEAYLTAMEKYDSRIGDVIDTALKGKQSGNRLVYDIKNSAQVSNAAVTGTLIGMLLPAVQQVRKAARRTESLNRLRMIVLASLNYESAHMRFPRNITDRDGNVLLSWRVAILPFMEQNHLYNQFHMDEPWNSDHNIALLDQMPDIFKSRGFKSDSKTLYQGFEGPGGIFEPGGRGIGFGSITDGSSNTIFCVECDPKSAVEWTRPQDLPFDLEEPITSVGKFRKGNFNAAYCDGSVHTFDFGSIANQLNKLIHRSDGSIINHDSLRRR